MEEEVRSAGARDDFATQREPFDLTGKVVLVTGGTSGIGRACALALAGAGADVAVNGHRNAEAGAETVEALEETGVRACFARADVRDREQVARMVDEVVTELGGLDVAVNNAMTPTGQRGLLEEGAEESWARAVESFLHAPFVCCLAEARHMIGDGGGSIVNMSSITGRIVNRTPLTTGIAAYSASKAALTHLTRVLAAEWAEHGIRVNSISPGFVRTRATRGVYEHPELASVLEGATPMGRFGEPDEVAGAVVYLASDAASFTTGSDLVVDGGYTVW